MKFIKNNISYLYVFLILFFILLPIFIVILVSFHEARYLNFPISSYSIKWYTHNLLRPEWTKPLKSSLLLATQTAIIATIIGIFAGLTIHNHDFKGKTFITTIFMSPLLFPQLLTGLMLLFFFANFGISGSYQALLMGHVIVSFPYVVRLVINALPTVSRSYEEAAYILGADELIALFKITLPIISPAIRGAIVFAFLTSYNNLMISLFLSTRSMVPMPIKIMHTIEYVQDPTIAAISTAFIIVTLVIILVVDRVFKIELVPLPKEIK